VEVKERHPFFPPINYKQQFAKRFFYFSQMAAHRKNELIVLQRIDNTI